MCGDCFSMLWKIPDLNLCCFMSYLSAYVCQIQSDWYYLPIKHLEASLIMDRLLLLVMMLLWDCWRDQVFCHFCWWIWQYYYIKIQSFFFKCQVFNQAGILLDIVPITFKSYHLSFLLENFLIEMYFEFSSVRCDRKSWLCVV